MENLENSYLSRLRERLSKSALTKEKQMGSKVNLALRRHIPSENLEDKSAQEARKTVVVLQVCNTSLKYCRLNLMIHGSMSFLPAGRTSTSPEPLTRASRRRQPPRRFFHTDDHYPERTPRSREKRAGFVLTPTSASKHTDSDSGSPAKRKRARCDYPLNGCW